jgi:hypothetical protein
MCRYAGLDTRGLIATGAWKDSKSAARYAYGGDGGSAAGGDAADAREEEIG